MSSPGHTKRISSRISGFKKHVSSVFSRSALVSPCLPENDTGRLDVPAHRVEDQLPPASISQHQSISNVSMHSAAKSISSHSSPSLERFSKHAEASAYQNDSSTHLAPPSPLQFSQQRMTFQEPSHPHYLSQGTLSQAHNFVMKDPVFIDNNTTVDNFMEKLLQATIIGAEFDSSDRHPPPRCHPGTRLAIIQRCLDFIVKSSGEEKLRWVVGPAGVGKSAVMQSVAEEPPDGIIFASVFLSVNGRQDGTRTIMTIAYQLAVKCEPYRQFIQNEITRDPSLLRKSLSVHFKRFIVEPFIHQHLFNPSDRFLILIDGLDECSNLLTQRELLGLISDFCITHPISPVVWIVASRPEPHITSFFDDARVTLAYSREEIMIDSDEASEDVQRFLRDELKKIELEYSSLRRKRQWPSELEFTKIATATSGLFAYASTVVRYIGDPYYGDPAAQLRHVLEIIDAGGKDDMLRRDHPMAQLDALYTRILSNIPDDVMINTRKLLLLYSSGGWPGRKFRLQCNTLGLAEDAAYGAVRHLHAVVKIPEPDKADDECLEYFHKSFQDFLFDSKRSRFSANVKDQVQQLNSQASLRMVGEVPDGSDGMASGEGIKVHGGRLKGGPGFCDNISLSWPGDERFQKTDGELKLELYCDAMLDMCIEFSSDSAFYGTMSCFHALTTRFTAPISVFPFFILRASAFDKFRRELTELSRLRHVPLRVLDYAAICGQIQLQFTSPIGVDAKLSDPWNPSCYHIKRDFDGLQQWQGWKTEFRRFVQDNLDIDDDVADTVDYRFNILAGKESHHKTINNSFYEACNYCSRRLARHFINNPDRPATTFVDSTEMCYLELSFVDPDDGVSEWRYRLFHSGLPKCIDT